MIVSRVDRTLHCDGRRLLGEPCREAIEWSGEEISVAEVRRDARANGWVRRRESRPFPQTSLMLDLCPACAERA